MICWRERGEQIGNAILQYTVNEEIKLVSYDMINYGLNVGKRNTHFNVCKENKKIYYNMLCKRKEEVE